MEGKRRETQGVGHKVYGLRKSIDGGGAEGKRRRAQGTRHQAKHIRISEFKGLIFIILGI